MSNTLHLPLARRGFEVKYFERVGNDWVAAVPDVQQRGVFHVRVWSPPVLVSVRKHRGGYAKNA